MIFNFMLCAGKLRDYVLEEGNVRVLNTCSDPERYCSTRAEPVFSALGQRLGKAMGPVGKAIKALGPAQVRTAVSEVGLQQWHCSDTKGWAWLLPLLREGCSTCPSPMPRQLHIDIALLAVSGSIHEPAPLPKEGH